MIYLVIQMKKIFIVILIIMFTACYNSKVVDSEDKEIIKDDEIVETEFPVVTDDTKIFETEIPIDQNNNELDNIENEEIDYLVKETSAGYQHREPYSVRFEIFEEIGAYEPSEIDVFVGENNDSLGFIYLSDFNISLFPNIYNEDYVKWQHGSGTGSYVYYGKMNKVADNVYAVDGKYPSDWYKLENLIADDIDFYAVFKKNALYIIFDQIDIDNIYNDLSLDDPHYTYRYDY